MDTHPGVQSGAVQSWTPTLSADADSIYRHDSLTLRWLVDEAGTPVSSEEMAGELESMLLAYITR